MTPIMYHIALHLTTGHFLVIHGSLDAQVFRWEIHSSHPTLEEAEKQVRELDPFYSEHEDE